MTALETAAEILERWTRIGPNTTDMARWAEPIAYGQPTPRRLGEPAGRDTNRNDDTERPGPPDHNLPGAGDQARRALQTALNDIRAADTHLCNAAAHAGIQWPTTPPRRCPANEIAFACWNSGPGVLIVTARTITTILGTVNDTTARLIERDLLAADRYVIRAHSALVDLLELELTTRKKPQIARRCANRQHGCPGYPRKSRDLCEACRKHLLRHRKGCPLCKAGTAHEVPLRPGILMSDDRLGPIEAAIDAKARRTERGEGWGAEDLSAARGTAGA